MSGIIGHTMYAVLAGKAAEHRGLPISGLIHRHYSSYLCGAYLGCDIQTLPESICVDTGKEVGFGTVPLQKSPLTGGAVQPWSLTVDGHDYRPREIHRLFYGRSHLVFGWTAAQQQETVPWDHLPDYCAAVVQDAADLFGPGERQLAYLFGWMAHIVGDSLIKSVRPGIDLELLGGKYTQRNRPIQDLVTFHEIGVKQLGIHWPGLLSDLADTPVEPVQLHYMRVGLPRGALAIDFPNAWSPELEPLLWEVLRENRRYQTIRNSRLLARYALRQEDGNWECSDELSWQTGGLRYAEMLEAAKRAEFEHAMWQMGEAIANLFEQVIERSPRLQKIAKDQGMTWAEITRRWAEGK